MAAIDAHVKLKLDITGSCFAGLDVADDDQGTVGDLNALAIRRGILLDYCEEWGERDTGQRPAGCARSSEWIATLYRRWCRDGIARPSRRAEAPCGGDVFH